MYIVMRMYQIINEKLKLIKMKKLNMNELINKSVENPDHYGGKDNVYEVINVCEAWDVMNDAYLFNVIKYVSRAGKKDKSKEIEDLKKAKWYLDRKIKMMEKCS